MIRATVIAAAFAACLPALAAAEDAAPARALTLEEALRTGLARQPQLREARAGADAGSARADQARAGLLPQVAGRASWQRATSNAPSLGGGSLATDGSVALGLDASQLLWDFGQTSGRWRASQAGATSLADSARASVVQVAAAIRSAYFGARAARDLVQVARETLDNQQRHLTQIRAFVEVGTRPPIDLAQARTDVANARVQLINAENGYAVARAQLDQAIGWDGPEYEVADEVFPAVVGEEDAREALLQEALAARPDLAALAEQVRAQDLTARALQGGYGPSVGVSTGVTGAGPHANDLTPNWSAALTLSWPLFQGGATRAQVREARANEDAASARLEILRLQIRLDLEQARLSVRASKAALAASDDAAAAARERLGLAEARYQTGVGNAIELGDAQVALTAALAQRVQADYRLASARSQLLLALGRG